MKSSASINKDLNTVLAHVLTAINQYFLHSKIFRNEGLQVLADKAFGESIREMKKGDSLTERILFLEGLPNFQFLHKINIGENASERIALDLKKAMENSECIKAAIINCEKAKDFTSRELLEDILEGEEEHIDWLETQQSLIERLGEQNYLSEQMFGEEEGQ